MVSYFQLLIANLEDYVRKGYFFRGFMQKEVKKIEEYGIIYI